MGTATGRFGCVRWVRSLALVLVLVTIAVTMGAPTLGARDAALQASPSASPGAGSETIEVTGLVAQPGPLTVTDLQQLPNETVEVTYETRNGPEQHTFVGTPLYGVIDQLGLQVSPDARNPLLGIYFVVTAQDGYQVVVSGGELDPNFGNSPMLLAWEQDGEPLSGEDGPVRLVAPGDTRGGRYVYGVIRIEVRGIEDVLPTPVS